jgi:hypothetical protein
MINMTFMMSLSLLKTKINFLLPDKRRHYLNQPWEGTR